jgi:glucose/arabinose dehydrogenase
MKRCRPIACLAIALVFGACNGDPETPPTPEPSPGTPETITGRERIGWLQQAGDAAEVASFDFAIYVDGARSVLQNDSCATAPGANGFECSAALPALTSGRHTLEIASFLVSGAQTIESARSAPLEVTVAAATAPVDAARARPSSAVTRSGGRLTATVVAAGLLEPADVAVGGAGGTVWVAEKAGHIRALDGDALRDVVVLEDVSREGGLLSITLDPDFDATRTLFAVYTADAARGPLLRVVRLREAGGRLGQAAVVFEGRVESAAAGAVARFGPDGRLYVAVGAGADPRAAQDASSLMGKILRLNADGSTPRDNPNASPVLSLGHRSPRGLAWDADGSMWAVDADEDGDEVNRVVANANYGWPLARGMSPHPAFTPPALLLRAGTGAAGAAFGPAATPLARDLFVAARGGQSLLRLRPGAADGRAALEALFEGEFGRLGQVAAGRTALYFVTANADAWGPGRDLLVRVDVDPGRRQ